MERTGSAWRVALASTCLLACPGRIDDPSPFLVHCPPDFNVETDLFASASGCGNGACHTASTMAGGLDLASPNPASRLILQSASGCPGLTLVSSPDSGLLFDKLNGTQSCGQKMPIGEKPVTGDQILCISKWAAPFFDGGGP
jgi:hypothetical protein